MAAAYWGYPADARHPPPPASAATPQAAAAAAVVPPPLKRPRPVDFPDASGAPEMAGYYSRDEERAGYRPIRDTEDLNASYDRYLRGMQSFGSGESIRPPAGGTSTYPADDRCMMGVGIMDSVSMGFGGGRPEPPLPPDASNTLFIEGLPPNCTRREASHIFRPFVGFQEVRLVNKESRHPGGDPLLLCFVDFSNAAQAAIALDALQGYKFDEHDRDSPHLRIQFARFAGPRSKDGPGGGRSRR